MDDMKARVYAVVDGDGRILQIEGEYSLSNIPDLSAAVLVEEGTPCDRLNHAQNMYLEKGLLTDDGIPLYKWDGGQVVPRTEAEIETDRAAIPPPPPSPQEQLRADVDFIAAMTGVML